MNSSRKTVLITGASRGIGLQIAHIFSEKGFYVVGTRTTNFLDDDQFNYCAEWIVADFNDLAQVYACAKLAKELSPDILINNAGINKIAPFVEIDPQDFLSIHQINVFAPFLLCQSVIPSMKLRSWGRIVNLSSIWGRIGKEYRASYSASKFALDGMTICLAAELSRYGILANCVAPGFINTDLTTRILGKSGVSQVSNLIPMGRMGTVTEVANFIAWLASEQNTYVTGQNLTIDGGFSRV